MGENYTYWKRLKMRTETVQLLRENTGQNPLDTGLSDDFLGCDAKSTRSKSKN